MLLDKAVLHIVITDLMQFLQKAQNHNVLEHFEQLLKYFESKSKTIKI